MISPTATPRYWNIPVIRCYKNRRLIVFDNLITGGGFITISCWLRLNPSTGRDKIVCCNTQKSKFVVQPNIYLYIGRSIYTIAIRYRYVWSDEIRTSQWMAFIIMCRHHPNDPVRLSGFWFNAMSHQSQPSSINTTIINLTTHFVTQLRAEPEWFPIKIPNSARKECKRNPIR